MKKLLTAFLFLSLLLSRTDLSGANENKFLFFSDVHFDPLYDTTLVHELVIEDFENWEKVFLTSKIKLISSYGSDSNFPLLVSSLEDMKMRIPEPDFIIITGDFMSHNFNENFVHYSGLNNMYALNNFIDKTMKFITLMITKHYPQTQIFPMLGNDDADCGNYMVAPGGEFLKNVSQIWEPLINKSESNIEFKNDFAKGGYCIANIPGHEKNKIIILNTVFFSMKYKNLCGDTLADPGAEELAWLSETLQQCRDSSFKVWMTYHIPPGIDIYGTITDTGVCAERIMSTWKKKYNDPFLDIISNYSDVINAGFAGHFHRDDFRVIYKENKPVSFIKLNSSISPIYGNNPAYEIVEYDQKNFTLLNYDTYYVQDIKTDSASWTFAYNFGNSFNQTDISPQSLAEVRSLIFEDREYRLKYIKYYTANNEKVYDKDLANWFYNWCGFANLTTESYENCFCNE